MILCLQLHSLYYFASILKLLVGALSCNIFSFLDIFHFSGVHSIRLQIVEK